MIAYWHTCCALISASRGRCVQPAPNVGGVGLVAAARGGNQDGAGDDHPSVRDDIGRDFRASGAGHQLSLFQRA